MSTRQFISRFPNFGDTLDILNSVDDDVELFTVSGANIGVGTTLVEVTDSVTAYLGYLTAADELRVKVGGNAADTAAGLGARTVLLKGLDATGARIEETLSLLGATASLKTSAKFLRLLSAEVATSGAVGAANTGLIEIETEGGVTVGTILATIGKTLMAIYTVPLGYTAYIQANGVSGDNAQACDFALVSRKNILDVTVPVSPFLVHARLFGVSGKSVLAETINRVPALTDIAIKGKAVTSTANISASIKILLIKD